MPLQITSETLNAAPNGGSRSRRTVGVGEVVTLTANHPVAQWTLDGTPLAGTRTSANAMFLTPGAKTVGARTASGEQASLQFNVVLPSLSVSKIRDVPPAGRIAAVMQLQFTLTPLEVSFAGIEMRELNCPPVSLWGYYTAGGAPNHTATPGWTGINIQNRLDQPDNAGLILDPPRMRWPIQAGGFEWRIPAEIRIGTQIHRLAIEMVQAARIDPVAGAPSGQFRGSITVWKGGQTTRQTFS